jgi:hypothetical protein
MRFTGPTSNLMPGRCLRCTQSSFLNCTVRWHGIDADGRLLSWYQRPARHLPWHHAPRPWFINHTSQVAQYCVDRFLSAGPFQSRDRQERSNSSGVPLKQKLLATREGGVGSPRHRDCAAVRDGNGSSADGERNGRYQPERNKDNETSGNTL